MINITSEQTNDVTKTTMDEEELKQILDEKIDEVFLAYQTRMGIESGDIEPLDALALEMLEDQVVNLILRVSEKNMGVRN